MKKLKINRKTKIILLMTMIIVVLLVGLLVIMKLLSDNNRDSNLLSTKSAIEHVFYYLPEDKYDDMNSISDYCKLALIFDSKFLENDGFIYDDNGSKIPSYSISSIMLSLRKVLGSNVTMDFTSDETGDYNFIKPDNCQFGNLVASNLSYDSTNKVVYPLDEIDSNRKVYINWTEENLDGNQATLYAQALMSVKTDSGYDLYVDFNMTQLIDHYSTLKKLKDSLNENYVLSYNYEFHLEKENENYIWKSFTKNIMNEMIAD